MVKRAVLLFLLVLCPGFGQAQAPVADKVVVDKSQRMMRLYAGGVEIATFEVSLGRQAVGAKRCEGDNKTPEGRFKVIEHKADSAYHLALRLSYPETVHIAAAKQYGCNPGGDIMIHGIRHGFGWLGSLHRYVDWTRGCIALTNEEMEKVWDLIPNGTIIEINA